MKRDQACLAVVTSVAAMDIVRTCEACGLGSILRGGNDFFSAFHDLSTSKMQETDVLESIN